MDNVTNPTESGNIDPMTSVNDKAYDNAVTKHISKIIAGAKACAEGRARWCQGCDETRLGSAMRWTIDGLYRCVLCVGPDVGERELWIDPWPDDDSNAALTPIIAVVPGGGLFVTGPGADKVQHVRFDQVKPPPGNGGVVWGGARVPGAWMNPVDQMTEISDQLVDWGSSQTIRR